MEQILERSIEKVEKNYNVLGEEKKQVKYWYHPEFKYTTNEEIVKLIQETDNTHYWDELDKRTEELYSAVLRDKVHPYYRENMKEDILSVLKIGWIKAVKSYDEERATAEFIPYCSFLMEQNYKMFARRINENKIGNSVRDEIMSCVTADGYSENEKMSQGCIDIIMKYDCEDYSRIESSDFVVDMLERLKMHDEIQYTIIKKHCIDGMTQKDLGIMLNMSQSAISRHIKKGMKFLQKEIQFEELIINA